MYVCLSLCSADVSDIKVISQITVMMIMMIIYIAGRDPRDSDLPLILGVSLGVGVPLIILIFILIICCCCACCPMYGKCCNKRELFYFVVKVVILI